MIMADACHLKRTAEGVYERDLTRDWWAQGAIHGGYILALAISAVEEEFCSNGMTLQQLSIHYLRPFLTGPLRAEVTVEKRGRRLAAASIRMFSAGKLSGVGVASVAHRRDTAEVALVSVPQVNPFEPENNSLETRDLTPIHKRVWLQPRIKDGCGPHVSRVGGWVALRSGEVVDHRWIAVLVDLWAPAVYQAWTPRHSVTTVDLTYHVRHQLPHDVLGPGGPVLVVLTNRVSAGGFVDEDVEVWSAGGVLLAQSRQMRFVNDLPQQDFPQQDLPQEPD